MRDTFANNTAAIPNPSPSGGFFNTATSSVKDYYYGLFSFTKSMLLHDNSGTGLGGSPIQFLQSLDNASNTPIDWYGAQAPPNGTDQTDGVARTLVNEQYTSTSDPTQFGSWTGHNYTTSQFPFETGWAVTMLNKTVFNAPPKACFSISPSSAIADAQINLDGSCSTDQNPTATIVSWAWSSNGTPLTASTLVKVSLPNGFACASPPCVIPITLTVTDNSIPALTGTVTNNITINGAQASSPTANAGGPYNFCPNLDAHGNLVYAPWILNGSLSTNPDQGKHLNPGDPTSTIIDYEWSPGCTSTYTPGTGTNTNSQLTIQGTGAPTYSSPFTPGSAFNLCLEVTNNDNLAFEDLSAGCGINPSTSSPYTTQTCSIASTTVTVHQTTDDECTHCVQTLGKNVKNPAPGSPGNIQLYWTDTNTTPATFPINHYNVYRSTSASFNPFVQVAGANSVYGLPAVQVPASHGATVYFQDTNVTGGTTYYYRVAPATINDTETCTGNITLQAVLGVGR
jgi:hypothetical protein